MHEQAVGISSMVNILSPGLAIGLIALTILIPLAFAIYWGIRGKGSPVRRVLRGAGTWCVLTMCQAIALTAVFLQVNQSYGFYTSWGQLLGQTQSAPLHNLVKVRRPDVKKIPISKHNPHPAGAWSGTYMKGTDPRYSHVPVWLPPQYFEKSQAHVRFPVLYWIGGLNDTGDHANTTVPLTGPAEQLIKENQVNPFAIAFLPGRIREGQDTECTNIGGIDHQSWILDDVIPQVEDQFRLGHGRAARFVGGYSTGGFCAALLTAKFPARFNAGFGLAPYFHPLFDPPQSQQATPRLLSENSVFGMVQRREVPPDVRYLSVISTVDMQAWSDPSSNGQIDGKAFWEIAHKDPQYSFMLLPQGGHSTGTYTPYIPQSLRWLGQYGL